MLDFTDCLGSSSTNQQIAQTLALALQISGAKLLELDSRELGVLTAPAGHNGTSWGSVIYDNVPGGAGHVLELKRLGREWLEAARQTLFVSSKHDGECEVACLDCILTYGAQDAMERGLVARRPALLALDAILGNSSLKGGIESSTNLPWSPSDHNNMNVISPDDASDTAALSREARLDRAAQRRRT